MPNFTPTEMMGGSIRYRRKLLGLSQEALALAAKITVPTLRRIEAGGRPVRVASWEALTLALSECETGQETSQ